MGIILLRYCHQQIFTKYPSGLETAVKMKYYKIFSMCFFVRRKKLYSHMCTLIQENKPPVSRIDEWFLTDHQKHWGSLKFKSLVPTPKDFDQ